MADSSTAPGPSTLEAHCGDLDACEHCFTFGLSRCRRCQGRRRSVDGGPRISDSFLYLSVDYLRHTDWHFTQQLSQSQDLNTQTNALVAEVRADVAGTKSLLTDHFKELLQAAISKSIPEAEKAAIDRNSPL